MTLKEKFIIKASWGFSAGIIVDLLIHLIYAFSGDSYLIGENIMDRSVLIAFFLEILTSGILGLVGNGGSVIYEIESWSIVKCTVTHFILAMSAFFAVGFFNGWLQPEINIENAIITGCVVIAYVMIWLMQYLSYKKEVRKINQGIKIFQKRGEAS